MKYTEKDFKDGDSVRITANTNFSINRIGDIGIVRKGHNGCNVDVPGRDATQGNHTLYSEIEPVNKESNYEIY